MSGGYTASTDAMKTASKSITQLAEDLPDKNPDLQNSPITAEGFGRAHGAHAQKYTDGVQKLVAAVTGYGTTLNSLGANIGTSGSMYGDNESSQSGAILNTDQGTL
ncbi:hypothetical protein [Amycolatopsis sp. GM8]|uniref:hypothetical protein n=1 Tax=Amycolatopsis sp. GM8 TaxID=2896530 RepID=UPI001F253B2E|nr:hypothetical protein [Amycolatopsis sp. GM8]